MFLSTTVYQSYKHQGSSLAIYSDNGSDLTVKRFYLDPAYAIDVYMVMFANMVSHMTICNNRFNSIHTNVAITPQLHETYFAFAI